MAALEISVQPLEASLFAPYGDVIELGDTPTQMINQGNCERFTDLAQLDFQNGGTAGISLFNAKPYKIPHTLKLLERHPLGSQAFIPMHSEPFLVIVAQDDDGKPVNPVAFATTGKQAVNYHRNTWHGVLTPVGGQQLFVVVDRIGGEGSNLQEHHATVAWQVTDPSNLLAV